jgi:hypothetical protein
MPVLFLCNEIVDYNLKTVLTIVNKRVILNTNRKPKGDVLNEHRLLETYRK